MHQVKTILVFAYLYIIKRGKFSSKMKNQMQSILFVAHSPVFHSSKLTGCAAALLDHLFLRNRSPGITGTLFSFAEHLQILWFRESFCSCFSWLVWLNVTEPKITGTNVSQGDFKSTLHGKSWKINMTNILANTCQFLKMESIVIFLFLCYLSTGFLKLFWNAEMEVWYSDF